MREKENEAEKENETEKENEAEKIRGEPRDRREREVQGGAKAFKLAPLPPPPPHVEELEGQQQQADKPGICFLV